VQGCQESGRHIINRDCLWLPVAAQLLDNQALQHILLNSTVLPPPTIVEAHTPLDVAVTILQPLSCWPVNPEA